MKLNRKIATPFKGDTAIWVIFLILSIISLVAVYSSIGLSAITSASTPHRALMKHGVFVLLSWVAVIVIANMNYRKLASLSVLGYIISIGLLVAVMFFGGSDAGSGTGRWLVLPGNIRFQPSELAKVVMVVYLARLLAVEKERLKEWPTFRNICLLTLLVVGLILPENLSTAAILFVTCFVTMRFTHVDARMWNRTVLALIAIGIVAILISSHRSSNSGPLARSETWTSRVDHWMHPDPDVLNQENMARMAVASGGLWGVGVGNTVHARLMTQAHNDFIYAIIIEEMGAFVAIIIFLLYAMLYFCCIRLVWKCKGTFGQLCVAGLGTLIFLQAAIHMGVSVGAFPVTGQTLPFISAGGSAYLCMALALGVIQAVAADVNRNERKAKERKAAATAAGNGDAKEESVVEESVVEDLSVEAAEPSMVNDNNISD